MSSEGRAIGLVDRWKLAVILVWLLFVAVLIFSFRTEILLFNLPDADDNMRLMQVKDLLHGQDWYDLRQYRANPPTGANIHWSRLVDLPIAALLCIFRAFADESHAERMAVAIAPLLPLLPAMYGLAFTVRSLIAPRAYPLAFAVLALASGALVMFVPGRIDHHNWQLALLALGIAGLVDSNASRGAAMLGISTALSIAIGLETVVYVAILGASLTLFWITDVAEAKRLRIYALCLGTATAVSFLAFSSRDNRHPVCDALSPVWLSDAILASTLLFALTLRPLANWRIRLGAALACGAVLAIFHLLAWPTCLSDLQQISPTAQRLWLSQIREALPIYEQSPDFVIVAAVIPLIGLAGYALLAWSERRDARALRLSLGVGAAAVAATLLMLWQTRTVAAAQLFAVPGCVAFVWVLVGRTWRARSVVVRIPATLIVLVIGTGLGVPLIRIMNPPSLPSTDDLVTSQANTNCLQMWAMRDIESQPKGLIMAFADLGPRLITLTRHDVVAVPYHRNQTQIIDVMNFWRGPEPQAHALAGQYHVNYVLSCPHNSQAYFFAAEAPDGFYEELQRGEVPAWLRPIPLPASSPFKMWKVQG